MLEAIKNEKPNRVKCDADEIDIYSQEEREHFTSNPLYHLDLPVPRFSLTACRIGTG